jgi:hypothetical protein
MAAGNPTDDQNTLSASEMRSWLTQEVRDLAKALELRVQEASAIVTAYAAGEISAKEAGERHWKYHERWGDALPGVQSDEKMTNRDILAMVDEARHPEFAKRLMQKHQPLKRNEGEPAALR